MPEFLARSGLGPVPMPGVYTRPVALVGDVCRACLDGPLTELDRYAESFLASIDHETTYRSSQELTFTCDYDRLLRWLLRVSYNGARYARTMHPLLKATAPFVVHGGSRPALGFVGVEVLRDHRLSPEQQEKLKDDGIEGEFVPARLVRVCRWLLDITEKHAVPPWCGRAVLLNAWAFYFLLMPTGLSRATRRRVTASYLDMQPETTPVSPDGRTTSVVVSRRTWVDAYAAQGQELLDAWQAYSEHMGRVEA